jgi:hypothetical protein
MHAAEATFASANRVPMDFCGAFLQTGPYSGCSSNVLRPRRRRIPSLAAAPRPATQKEQRKPSPGRGDLPPGGDSLDLARFVSFRFVSLGLMPVAPS